MISKYKDGEISSGQSYVMIISVMVGTGVLGLARSVAEISNQDAWISVLINGIFIGIIVGITIFVISKFPEYNFLQYTSFLLTKPIAYVIVGLYAVYSTLTAALVIRFLCEMVGTWFLPRTPLYIISFIIVAALVYITKDGLTVVGRFNEIMVLSIIPIIFLIFPSLTEASLLNLQPVGGTGIIQIVKGIIPSFYAFGGYEVILIIFPYISNKNRNNLKYSVVSILFVVLLYTSLVASQLALFGYQEISGVLYSFINYLDVVDFPIIERIEIFFTFFWTFAVLGTLSIQYIVGCISLQMVFKTKKLNTFAYVLAPFVFLFSILPENSSIVVAYSDKVGKSNIGFGLILPLLLLIMYLIKGRKSKCDESV